MAASFWTSTRQGGQHHHPHAPDNPPDEGHRRMSLETLSRFLHAFQNHHEGGSGAGTSRSPAEAARKVHPQFDLIEGANDYKIYGELPGLTSDDIHVDVNDHLFTVTISGEFKVPGEVAALQQEDTIPVTHRDAGVSGAKESAAGPSEPKAEDKPAEENQGGRKREEALEEEQPKKEEEQEGGAKEEEKITYHIKERNIGRFKREFQFPIEVVVMADVKAQCRHGLLSIAVPKHTTPPSQRKKGRKLDVE